MHELGIAARIVEVAVQRATAGGATQITEVHLEVGADCGVAPESLELYWPQVTRGTPAEGARLDIGEGSDPLGYRLVAIDVADEDTGRPGQVAVSIQPDDTDPDSPPTS